MKLIIVLLVVIGIFVLITLKGDNSFEQRYNQNIYQPLEK